MKLKKTTLISLSFAATLCGSVPVIAAGDAQVGVQQMADAIFAVIEADRATYTQKVVHRLQNEEDVIKADEHWKEESALPLPAQMLRMGAERVTEKKAGFNYALLSPWAINKQNLPRTELEKKAFTSLSADKQNFYGEETLGDQRYFTAVYPDVAVSQACISCHNKHMDSPKKDFKLGDTMGGLVIRIPLK